MGCCWWCSSLTHYSTVPAPVDVICTTARSSCVIFFLSSIFRGPLNCPRFLDEAIEIVNVTCSVPCCDSSARIQTGSHGVQQHRAKLTGTSCKVTQGQVDGRLVQGDKGPSDRRLMQDDTGFLQAGLPLLHLCFSAVCLLGCRVMFFTKKGQR